MLKELERKHTKERDLLLDLLQEGDSEDLREEARGMSADERNKRLAALREKRDRLDLSLKGNCPYKITQSFSYVCTSSGD